MQDGACVILSFMEWETYEHQFTEKNNDWYASVILIAGSLVAVEFLVGNFLLILLTIIATIAVILVAVRRPDLIAVAVQKNGVLVGSTLYTYGSLDGFAIREYFGEYRLLLESNRHFMPLISVPISDEVSIEDLHEMVARYLPERDLHESLPHLLFEHLGF